MVSFGKTALTACILGGFAIGALSALALLPDARSLILPAENVKVAGRALVGGPFALTDHTGRRVTDQDFRGRYMLVFFGFTYCPDVCPSALQLISAALDRLGPKAERVVPLFITLDPERDTPEHLAEYVKSFHPRLIGLTGSASDIEAAAKAYRVYFRKVADPKSTAEYTIDHTVFIYVMGPDGTYRTHFTHATPLETVVGRLAEML
jgi:protein SCO1/2